MASLFISYSRKDIEIARKLTDSFKGQNLDFWIDWEGIPPTVDWWKEIEQGIEQADIFLFLISPDSAKSKVCSQEIEHAAKNGKRLIPIVIRDIKADESPPKLGALNWIFIRENDDFNLGFSKIITAIKTDYGWVQSHRQLQVKALEWERSNHETSFFLRGKELQEAEFQLATSTSKEPHPTDLQREYVFKSRQAADRQRRITTVIAIAVIITLAALAAYAFVEAGLARDAEAAAETNLFAAQTAQADAENKENARAMQQALAEERAKIARAGELTTQSVSVRDSQLDLASLLGIEAFNTWDYFRTRSVLVNNLNTNPHLRQYMFRHNDWISAIVFNPKTDMLASGGCSKRIDFTCVEGEIVLWSIPNGELNKITSIHGHSSAISSLAFNPAGTILATGGCSSFDAGNCAEGEIILWNTENYQQIGKPFNGHSEEVLSLTFSPDGKLLASGSCATHELSACAEGEILLWNIEDHSQFSQPIRGHTSWVSAVAFSPDGHFFASGSGDGTVLLRGIQQGQITGPVLSFGSGFEIINSLEFSPDGKTLVSAGTDDRLKLWDVTNGQLMREFTGHEDDVYAVAFSPDGKLLASGGVDQSIVLWDKESGQAINRLLGHSGIVTSLAFGHDGKFLASASADSKVILWDIGDNLQLGDLVESGKYGLSNIAFDMTGNTLITEIKDNSIIVSDLQSKQMIGKPIRDYPETSFTLALSPDNQVLAIGGENIIFMWDLTNGQPLLDEPIMGHSGWVSSIVFSPDGKLLASGGCQDRREDLVCTSGKILIWNVKNGQMIGEPLIGHTSWVDSLAFSADGKLLASGSSQIQLWDLSTHQIIGIPFLGHVGKINSISFSPDGKMLASAGNDGAVILWDVETHQPIINPFHKQFSGISSLAFSPNGEYLISADSDGNIMLWEAGSNRWKLATCQRIGRNFTQEEWALYFPGEDYRITCPQWPAGN